MRITRDANCFELNSYSCTLVNYPSVMEKQNPKTTGDNQEDTKSASQFPAEAGKTSSFSLCIPSSHMLTGTDQEVVERTAVWSGRKNSFRIHLGRGCMVNQPTDSEKCFLCPQEMHRGWFKEDGQTAMRGSLVVASGDDMSEMVGSTTLIEESPVTTSFPSLKLSISYISKMPFQDKQ